MFSEEKKIKFKQINKMDSIGNYEYNKKDLIGHGAFAIVYKGRQKTVITFIS